MISGVKLGRSRVKRPQARTVLAERFVEYLLHFSEADSAECGAQYRRRRSAGIVQAGWFLPQEFGANSCHQSCNGTAACPEAIAFIFQARWVLKPRNLAGASLFTPLRDGEFFHISERSCVRLPTPLSALLMARASWRSVDFFSRVAARLLGTKWVPRSCRDLKPQLPLVAACLDPGWWPAY